MGSAQAKGESTAADAAARTEILRKHWLRHARGDSRDQVLAFLEGAARDASIEFAQSELCCHILVR